MWPWAKHLTSELQLSCPKNQDGSSLCLMELLENRGDQRPGLVLGGCVAPSCFHFSWDDPGRPACLFLLLAPFAGLAGPNIHLCVGLKLTFTYFKIRLCLHAALGFCDLPVSQ